MGASILELYERAAAVVGRLRAISDAELRARSALGQALAAKKTVVEELRAVETEIAQQVVAQMPKETP